MSTWAVLAAGGRGERLDAGRPKAFARLGGRPLLAESLERLEASAWVDAIVLVAPEEWEEPAILLSEELGCGKVSSCVTGGPTRAESVRLGVAEVPDDAAAILVHDAARPLLSDEVVERVVAALGEGWDGAVPGSSSQSRLRRPSSPRSCVWRSRARSRERATAPRSSRHAAGGSRSSRETGGC